MRKREKLKKLVFAIIRQNGEEKLTAEAIYEEMRYEDRNIIFKEKIKGFRSFVKILNSFKEIEHEGETGKPFFYKVMS